MICNRLLHIVVVAFLAVIPFSRTAAASDSTEVPRISIELAIQMIARPGVVFIDVRTAKSWWRSSQKIANAVREEPGSPEKWAKKYAADRTLIFYCT